MTCDKCGGLVVHEYEEIRCLNCGKQFDAVKEDETMSQKCAEKWCRRPAVSNGVCEQHAPIKKDVPVAASVKPSAGGGLSTVIEQINKKIAALQAAKATLEQVRELL